jgi:YidC/Oxa1 family membrane protein insertase
MIGAAFHSVIYVPLYNALVWLVDVLPMHDMGLAVIALTIAVRVVLIPLSRRAVETQMVMKELAPEIEALKVKHKDDKEAQGKAIFALYKERGVHPFAGLGLVLLQFPVLVGLYWVFSHGGLPSVDSSLLYGFVRVPEYVHMDFLGLVPLSGHSISLAVAATISQLIYTRLSMGAPATVDPSPVESTLSGDLAKSFDTQARYVLPLFIGVISYSVAAAAPLYWTTSNLFMIAQEYVSGRRF